MKQIYSRIARIISRLLIYTGSIFMFTTCFSIAQGHHDNAVYRLVGPILIVIIGSTFSILASDSLNNISTTTSTSLTTSSILKLLKYLKIANIKLLLESLLTTTIIVMALLAYIFIFQVTSQEATPLLEQLLSPFVIAATTQIIACQFILKILRHIR